MISYAIVAVIAYVAGAFSHKWAAAAFKSETGVTAQDVADKIKDSVR